MQQKPWQIVLFVVALGAIVFALYRSLSHDKLDLPNSIVMVDVQTGELFRFSTSGKRGVGVPNFNPDTNKVSLLPVLKDEGGKWFLTDRAQPILADLKVPHTAVVDLKTGEVKTHGSVRPVKVKAHSGS